MNLRLHDAAFERTSLVTRTPFRFGAVTMTDGVLLQLRVAIEGDAGPAEGVAADLLVPKWFDKNPDTSADEDRAALAQAAEDTVAAVRARPAATLFETWWSVYGDLIGGLERDDPRRMVRGFGLALVERALMDAACRAAGVSFFEAWGRDLFGFRPGEVHAQLAGWDVAGALPAAPRTSVALRHTVGMLDPLRVEDVEPQRRLDDGFPQALADDIDAYGLTWFKIKIGAGPERDAARLLELARFFAARGMVGARAPRFTLDGNEQYETLDQLADLLRRVRREADGAAFLGGLQFIEQPLHRLATFDAGRNRAIDEVVELGGPVILDEADSAVDSFPRALALGYAGISVKNCKGVFRAMLNRGLCTLHDGAFQSAEDLTNLPTTALQQDLCTVATLGLEHVERNGHHYFRGLDHVPPAAREAALAEHPDLYRRTADGGVALRIEHGQLGLASLQRPGFGA